MYSEVFSLSPLFYLMCTEIFILDTLGGLFFHPHRISSETLQLSKHEYWLHLKRSEIRCVLHGLKREGSIA